MMAFICEQKVMLKHCDSAGIVFIHDILK